MTTLGKGAAAEDTVSRINRGPSDGKLMVGEVSRVVLENQWKLIQGGSARQSSLPFQDCLESQADVLVEDDVGLVNITNRDVKLPCRRGSAGAHGEVGRRVVDCSAAAQRQGRLESRGMRPKRS